MERTGGRTVMVEAVAVLMVEVVAALVALVEHKDSGWWIQIVKGGKNTHSKTEIVMIIH